MLWVGSQDEGVQGLGIDNFLGEVVLLSCGPMEEGIQPVVHQLCRHLTAGSN